MRSKLFPSAKVDPEANNQLAIISKRVYYAAWGGGERGIVMKSSRVAREIVIRPRNYVKTVRRYNEWLSLNMMKLLLSSPRAFTHLLAQIAVFSQDVEGRHALYAYLVSKIIFILSIY